MTYLSKSAPKFALAAVAVSLLTLPAAAQAPELMAQAWTVDHAQSRLGFAAVSDGEGFGGHFGQWDAQIAFDPANLGASSATVTIAMASVSTEDTTKAATLQEDAWFAPSLFPNATFRTTAIRAEGDGYVADGTLTIRDVSKDVSLPFALTIDGDTARMNGKIDIDRKAFGVGGSWQDSHADAKVTVEVSIVAKKS